jgi:glucose-fructose oxidoreductase
MKTKDLENEKTVIQPRFTFSRRDFLRSMLGGAAIFTLGLDLRAQETLAKNNGRKLGVALLGLGRYATGELAPALKLTNLCELRGIVTGTPAKAEKWTADYNLNPKNVYNYQNMDKIADNPEIDIVYVVTPPGLHPEFAIRAAKAGKHVISEKPMATSVADCTRMIEACQKAKVKLGIGYRLHYDPYHLEMKRIGKAQEFGRFNKINGRFAYVMGQKEHRTDKKLAGGGPLMDLGIYIVHQACIATGSNPVYVAAKEEAKQKPELFNEVEETISFRMEFPNGEICEGFTSFNNNGNNFRLDAAKGWLDFKGQAFSYRGVSCETSRGALSFPAVSQQALQIDDFADCLINNRQTQVPGELGRRDIQILMAIYEAAQTGKRVKVKY